MKLLKVKELDKGNLIEREAQTQDVQVWLQERGMVCVSMEDFKNSYYTGYWSDEMLKAIGED